MDDTRLVLLRDCAVARPDGMVTTLTFLKPGSTLARINSRFVGQAVTTLKAWGTDQSLLLPDVIIWPCARSLREAHLVLKLRERSVAAVDNRVDGILDSDEAISSWKVSGANLVHTSGPRRRVDHVIDLGDVLR